MMVLRRLVLWVCAMLAVVPTEAFVTLPVFRAELLGRGDRARACRLSRQCVVAAGTSGTRLQMAGEGGQADDGGEREVESTWLGGDELQVMVFREKLEAQFMRSRIKSKPRFLPFETAVQWARRSGYWSSREEWFEWLEMGERKNPYIPSNPEEYYGRRGEWKGWCYFLGVKEGCSPEELVTAAWRSSIWLGSFTSEQKRQGSCRPETLVKAAWLRKNKPDLSSPRGSLGPHWKGT